MLLFYIYSTQELKWARTAFRHLQLISKMIRSFIIISSGDAAIDRSATGRILIGYQKESQIFTGIGINYYISGIVGVPPPAKSYFNPCIYTSSGIPIGIGKEEAMLEHLYN